ncbi:MAG: hypothetical protein WCO33_00995 [bacterium]
MATVVGEQSNEMLVGDELRLPGALEANSELRDALNRVTSIVIVNERGKQLPIDARVDNVHSQRAEYNM